MDIYTFTSIYSMCKDASPFCIQMEILDAKCISKNWRIAVVGLEGPFAYRMIIKHDPRASNLSHCQSIVSSKSPKDLLLSMINTGLSSPTSPSNNNHQGGRCFIALPTTTNRVLRVVHTCKPTCRHQHPWLQRMLAP